MPRLLEFVRPCWKQMTRLSPQASPGYLMSPLFSSIHMALTSSRRSCGAPNGQK